MTTPTSTRRRYPGAKPFEQSQQDIFFGRQAAIEALYRRISLERLTVLYGKSGDGKSSLINAGIIPLLETEATRPDVDEADTFLPVKIRFEAYQPGQAGQLSPVEKAVGQLVSTPPPAPPPMGGEPSRTATKVNVADSPPIGGGAGGGVAQKLLPADRSLWATVKDRPDTERGLLLIFDQFEELFTYPEAQYDTFGQQLAELLNVLVPMRYVHALEQNPGALTEEENARLHRQPKVHVLLAIRSDRLNLLNRLQAHLPNIQKINYELPPLTKTEARDAILLPAGEEGDFASPAFAYAPGALRKIIHSLTDGDQQPIASFQLQILCESIEDKVLAQQLTHITEADVEDPAALYENYYRERIARLGDLKDQAAARRLIEDGLILEEENRRLSLYEGQIRKTYGVPDRVLQQLENDHLLRREPNLQGGYSYELSHDTLVRPIAKFKKQRREEERRREVRKQRLRLAGAVNVAALAILAALWSYGQFLKANKFSRIVQNSALFSTLRESNPTLALNIAKYNYERHFGNNIVEVNREQSLKDFMNPKFIYNSRTFIGHSSYASSVAFSPDGKYFLTSSWDNTAKLWDLSGGVIQPFIGHVSTVSSAAFSPNGNYVLTGSDDKTAKLWSPSGVEIQSFIGHTSSVSSVAFSPDGKHVLTGSWDNTTKLWDLSGCEILSFIGHASHISSVAFSPDGKYVLTGSGDETAKLWDLSGHEIQSFIGHTDKVLSVTFSPDGKYILTGSDDKTAKLWNLSGVEIQPFIGHSSYVSTVAFSPDGKYILTGSGDKMAKLWNLSGREIQSLTGHASTVSSVAFSPDGKYLLTGSDDKTAKLWNLSERESQSFTGHTSSVSSATFSPNGKYILTGSGDNSAKLRDLSGDEIQSFLGHASPVNSVAFSPDGKYILTGSWDKTAKLWDLSGHEIQSFLGHASPVNSVAFSPDSKYVLTGSDDKTSKLWELSGYEIQLFKGHDSYVWSVAFSPDGKYILTGSDDKTAKLWNLSGREIRAFIGHTSSVWSVAFSPDGKYILTGSGDKTAKLWDLSGHEIQTFIGHTSYVRSVAFSPDGKYILTGSGDNSARLWRVDTGQVIKIFVAHMDGIMSVAFSPNGRTILTGYADGTTKLWRIDEECVECRVHQYSLLELWEAGVQLEPEDLREIGKEKNKE